MRSVPDSLLSRCLAVLATAALGTAGVPAGSTTAAAAEVTTAAPIVIAGVHTDAISTFWEDGGLVLASKADTPTLHTRYEAEDVWFHVDNGSLITNFPDGYGFVAPAGTAVWLAPEVQQPDQIWPGFSTESVPVGTLDNDDTTLTLLGVEGPGDVELWQTGSFGAVQRLWSSDEAGLKSFTRKNVHMHANWAFTAAGTYHLTVKADAAVAGASTSDTAVYTFVVGDLPSDIDPAPSEPGADPAPVATTVTAAEVTQVYGKTAPLVVSVSPNATGQVMVEVGTETVSGVLSDGEATVTLPIKQLMPGKRSVAISYTGISGTFEPAAGNATVNVTRTVPTVKVKRVRATVRRGGTATFQVGVSASGVRPGGKITVRIGGKKKAAKLNSRGRATVRVVLPWSVKPGKRKVLVSYGGDTYVARGSTSTKLKVTR